MWTSTDFKEMFLLLCRNIFFLRHIWCIKSRTRLFIYLPSFVSFSKYLRQDMPYKAEIWHVLSNEQSFLKHTFLDICRCAFNWWKVSNELISK